MTLPSYTFDGYLFRPAGFADLKLAREWNAADPDHAWEMDYPYFWIENTERTNGYALEDKKGVVFFVKSIRQPQGEIEISLQFDRSESRVSRRRAVIGMWVGFRWLKKSLPANGFCSVYFVTRNQPLGAFAAKALGFEQDGERYVFRFNKEEDHGETHSKDAQGNSDEQVCGTAPILPGSGQEPCAQRTGAGREQVSRAEEESGCQGA